MNKTILSIEADKFLVNGKLTYSEIENSNCKGLLLNARFIQAMFDDKDRLKYNRFGKIFDPEVNTDEFIKSLKQWYDKGLRGVTVGVQGGGPCFTILNKNIENNPFSNDGKTIDEKYLNRLHKILKACDDIGMVAIVSYFYMAQCRFFQNDDEVRNAVKTMSKWLKETGFQNVIIEIENEYDIDFGSVRPSILIEDAGIVELMKIAKEHSGGLPVGCSGTGGHFSREVAEASDVILIHGNGQSPQQYYNLMQKAKAVRPIRPVVCNEDSQAISRLDISVKEGVSWGYYNNATKQEPPVYWEITKGEDEFFAKRMATACGIIPKQTENEFHLQGLSENEILNGEAWIRLASLYPEKIEYVEFFRNNELIFRAYDEPFLVNFHCTWKHFPITELKSGEVIEAKIHLRDETVKTIKTIV